MTNLLWTPPADPAWTPLLERGRALAGEQSPVALAASGLMEQVARQFVGRDLPLAAVCAVLDMLAVSQPRLAVALSAGLVGGVPLLCLGLPHQQQSWLDGRGGTGLAIPGPGGLDALHAGDDWSLCGEAEVLAADEAASGMARTQLVAFACLPAASVEGGGQWRAFLVDAVCLSAPIATGAYVQSVRISLGASHLLRCEGDEVATAYRQAIAVRRILVAALHLGICRTAFEDGLAAASEARTEAVSRLMACAAGVSGARALLQEALRVVASPQGYGGALPAMALLAATECVERVVYAATQIAGRNSGSQVESLQRIIAARHIHEALVGFSDPREALWSEARDSAACPRLSVKESSAMSRPTVNVHPSSAKAVTRPAPAGDRVAEILDAAAEAFTQQSYDATSIDHIGDAIGVTKGSIYHHYRSKADLFMAVYRRAMELNIAKVEPIMQWPGIRSIDRLYGMAYAHALQVIKHLAYQRVAVQGLEAHLMGRVTEEQRERLKEVIALRDRYEDMFTRAIGAAVEAGELPQQSPRQAVKPLFGAINWTTMWYQRREGETAADRKRIAARLADFVISGLLQTYRSEIDLGSIVNED